jgi:hypothetical protein
MRQAVRLFGACGWQHWFAVNVKGCSVADIHEVVSEY